MEFRPLPADEPAVRRYVQQLWLPYQHALEETVEEFELVDRPEEEIVEAELAFRMDLLDSEDYQILLAVETTDEEPDVAAGEGDLVGFVTTSVDEAPSVFDRSDRLLVGDFYVRERFRGRGLAQELLERAAVRAGEEGCPELKLDVDVGNGRATAFYEKVGFETARREMHADASQVRESLGRSGVE